MSSSKFENGEEEVFEHLHRDISYLKNSQFEKEQKDLWTQRVEASLKKFCTNSQKINRANISNFRRTQVFLSETPTYQSLFPVSWLSGRRRGQRRLAKERLGVLKREGDAAYLKRHPISLIGNPFYFKIEDYYFNERWSRHIRYLHIAAKYLQDFLSLEDATVLDIGAGYGIFSGLLKKEFSHCRSGIVEFPEQLLLAYYYLAMNFPNAKINSLQEVCEASKIDRDFVRKYDFLLIPIHCYPKIAAGVFHLVANFTSLGEMSEKSFNFYLNAKAFQSAKYFFTVNRFESRPTYETDLSILDYRLYEFEKIHFQISPLFGRYYESKFKFFTTREYFTSQCFEFIGKRKNSSC